MLYYVDSSRNKVYSLQICLHYTPCSRKTHEHSHKTWVYNPLETCVLEGDEHIRWLGYAFISIKKIAMHFFFLPSLSAEAGAWSLGQASVPSSLRSTPESRS